ncbi:MAG: hypothetical protein J6X89_08945 [Bacteroidales bacterium]|nr:hypothetical protein [Bacteroidales bacterium]
MKQFVKRGTILKASLEDGTVRFFQFVGQDSSDLNGDVIRIFARHYDGATSVAATDIVNDAVECYMHTIVSVGLELGLWEQYADIADVGNLDIYFRTSEDFMSAPGPSFVSHKWVVWKMNGERNFVGTLPVEYRSADLGGVYAPKHVLYRLSTGQIPDKFYPGY